MPLHSTTGSPHSRVSNSKRGVFRGSAKAKKRRTIADCCAARIGELQLSPPPLLYPFKTCLSPMQAHP